jgi:CheY-like chemotaxis protein
MQTAIAEHLEQLVPSLMIADGDGDSRLLHKIVLTSIAETLLEAEDGVEALAKASGVRPDVIVTAARLARIDGYALCALLRLDRRTHRAGIVITTADAFPADIARALDAGADEVLVKPYLPEDLIAAVCRSWQRRQGPAEKCAPIG